MAAWSLFKAITREANDLELWRCGPKVDDLAEAHEERVQTLKSRASLLFQRSASCGSIGEVKAPVTPPAKRRRKSDIAQPALAAMAPAPEAAPRADLDLRALEGGLFPKKDDNPALARLERALTNGLFDPEGAERLEGKVNQVLPSSLKKFDAAIWTDPHTLQAITTVYAERPRGRRALESHLRKQVERGAIPPDVAKPIWELLRLAADAPPVGPQAVQAAPDAIAAAPAADVEEGAIAQASI